MDTQPFLLHYVNIFGVEWGLTRKERGFSLESSVVSHLGRGGDKKAISIVSFPFTLKSALKRRPLKSGEKFHMRYSCSPVPNIVLQSIANWHVIIVPSSGIHIFFLHTVYIYTQPNLKRISMSS